ncbi:MAG: hypothetical protein ACC652_11620 [Acidimicrobiales bacterium]
MKHDEQTPTAAPSSVDGNDDISEAGADRLMSRLLPLVEMDSRDRWIELFAAFLLAVATVGSAWSAYESSRWGGVQAVAFSEAAGFRDESNSLRARGDQLVSIDAGIFTQWAAAFAVADDTVDDPNSDDQLTSFMFSLMRDDFRPAMDAWLVLKLTDNANAPKSPFEMEEYSLPQHEQAEVLLGDSAIKGAEARDANQTSDDYVLSTVLFASVLFFAGISSKFKSRRIRVFLLLLAFGTVAFATGRVATLPYF